MTKYLLVPTILATVLLTGCAPKTPTPETVEPPIASIVGEFGYNYELERFVDTTQNVVCYKASSASLSCVYVPPTNKDIPANDK